MCRFVTLPELESIWQMKQQQLWSTLLWHLELTIWTLCSLDYQNLPQTNYRKSKIMPQKLQPEKTNKITFNQSSSTFIGSLWINRIKYKIALLTFKCLKDLAPHYLKDKLLIYVPSRLLRSGEGLLLVQPKSNQKHFGDRAFSIIAPRIWNLLPLYSRTVKHWNCSKVNKTYIFYTL